MGNLIVIVILIIAAVIGVRESMKHFRGEGGCCGGSSDKVPKKKLENPVIQTYTFHVEDMHCENCVSAVTKVVNNIDGAAAKVSLKKQTAIVSCDREIDPEVIAKAITARGYAASLMQP